MTDSEKEVIKNRISSMEYPCGYTDEDIREAAKGLVAFCIRNNTSLEDYHAEQVPITDERMRRFMTDCVNNVYLVLAGLCSDDGEIFSNQIEGLKAASKKYAARWDDPEIPEFYYKMVEIQEEDEQTSAQVTEKPVEKVTIERLYAAVVEEINSHDERFREYPMALVAKVCRERFGVEYISSWDGDFEIYHLLRSRAKENGYAMREVPFRLEGPKEGLPYSFECFFYPNKSRDDRLCGGIKMPPVIPPKEYEQMRKNKND